MNKNIKKIYNKIKFEDEIQGSLADYLGSLAGVYKDFSQVNIAMFYFMFYENYIERYHKMDDKDLAILNRLNKFIDKVFVNSNDMDKSSQLNEIDEIRKHIIHQMKIITNYTDILLVYEYVLKRIEHRYDTDFDALIDDQQATKEILSYIFNSEDQAVITQNISDVISELPVRMSRYKYFDLIEGSFSIFEGKSPSFLESYLYVIRSSSMLYKPDSMEDAYPLLNKMKKDLETANYSDLKQEDWERLSIGLENLTQKVNDYGDYFYSLQEIVNELYIYVLSNSIESNLDEEVSAEEIESKQAILTIIKNVNLNFANNSLETEDETQDLLVYCEGVQEPLLDDIALLESLFTGIKDKHGHALDKLNLEESYKKLETSQKFFSSSLFFELDKVEDSRTITNEDIDKEKKLLIIELEDLFKKNSRYVNRAVMARTLDKIPGFLKDSEELYEYIESSLKQCRDLAEKSASINEIKALWE